MGVADGRREGEREGGPQWRSSAPYVTASSYSRTRETNGKQRGNKASGGGKRRAGAKLVREKKREKEKAGKKRKSIRNGS